VSNIKWSQIEAECGDYRSGFVATFRKYEGQPTDEKDARNLTVKVTISSFARHMNIPEPTFREWANNVERKVLPKDRARLNMAAAKRAVDEATPEEKAELSRQALQDPAVVSLLENEIVEHAASTPRRTARTIERASEKRPAPRKPDRDPSALDYLAVLGVGSEVYVKVRGYADKVSTLVSCLRGGVPEADADAVREDIADLRKASNAARIYADELEVALDGGVSDANLEALLNGEH
jgi:hypothetical protein